MLTLRRRVVAFLLAIACVLFGSTTSTAQSINVRGYLDVGSPSGDGPLILIGDNGFTFSSALNFRDWVVGPNTCIGDPNACAPGKSLSLSASANSEAGLMTYQGTTHRVTGGIDSPAGVGVIFSGSVTLPPLAPTAVVTANFTFRGGFNYNLPNGVNASVAFNDSHGTATVFLVSPASPVYPNTWRVARVLYQLDQAPLPVRWTYGDIGNVGQPGSSAFSNGQFQVSGAGGDIWGTADAFHYLFITADHGPSGVVARVDSFSAPQAFAKAGVMVRQTLEASSPHVILDVKPDGAIEFMTRSAPGRETTFIAGATATLPVWLRLSVAGGNVVGSMSSDGVAWTTVGSTPFGSGFEGVVVTSHDTSVTAQAAFEGLAAGPEWPWYQADVGDVVLAGNAEVVQQQTLVSGSGADIWGTADAFHFLYSVLPTGNRIVARVVGEQGADPFAKAGLVMGDFATDGRRVILDAKPDGNIEFMSRNSPGTPMAFIAGANASFPVWLRLTVTGDVFTGEMSTDGATWTTVGSVTMTHPTGLAAGLAVTSHNREMLNIAQFDHIGFETAANAGQSLLVNGGFEDSVVPNVGPGWVSDPIRQVAAKSETNQPHSGSKNGACWATTSEDCGIYQEVAAPTTGTYTLTLFANADRSGGLVGANVNGRTAVSQPVDVGAFGNYGLVYNLSFHAVAGDSIRVWMYSPASPGYVVIDDVSLTLR
jgi:hypothetical protein